ncbi:ATP-binding protein [Actinomadura scrupuli]|uniref:ATP-binding protein n=1 Tax=Actinomadura scrupuli TaxID=559629 RepID=UPI003D9968F6
MRSEQIFEAEPGAVPGLRRWAGGLVPVRCAVRDEAVLIFCELATNAATHGTAEKVRVIVEHGGGGLRGAVRELGAVTGHPVPDPRAVAEMRALARLGDGEPVDPDDLRETGRGLALIAALCGDDWGVRATPDGREVWFLLALCRCPGAAGQR